MDSNWLKQDDEPLFPNILWQKPEHKARAGKLLIAGGHAHGFDLAAKAMQAAIDAGIGEVKAVLPDTLKSVVGKNLPSAVFSTSETSGGLAESSLPDILSFTQWADAIMLVQPGGSSSTALVLDRLCRQTQSKLIITDEAAEALKTEWAELAKRKETLWVLSFSVLQKLISAVNPDTFLRHDMGARPLAMALQAITTTLPLVIVTELGEHIFVSINGRVVSTHRAKQPDMVSLAGFCTTWWVQQPTKPLEALATAVFEF